MTYELTMNTTDLDMPATFATRDALLNHLHTTILDDDDWCALSIVITYVPSHMRNDDRMIELVAIHHDDDPDEPVTTYRAFL